MKRSIIASLAIASVFCQAPGFAQSPTYKAIAGCYELKVGEWNRALRGAERFQTIPTSVRLDTAPTPIRGRMVTPDISDAMWRPMRGMPRWEILGDTLRIAWSNGFSPTVVRLTQKGTELRGWAEAMSDAIPPGKPDWPRAEVLARRIACAK